MTAGAGRVVLSVEALLGVLDLEAVGPDRFRGSSPRLGWRRVFGGQVVAQALVAVQRTVEVRPVHSLHAYFMLPGDPERPIDYRVERLRDGGSFTTRRCVASQADRPIFALSASFHVPEPEALDHAAAVPAVPAADILPSAADIRAGGGIEMPDRVRALLGRDQPVEIRPVDLGAFVGRTRDQRPTRLAVWLRVAGPVPDRPDLHSALLAYMSDMMLLDAALAPHGTSVFDQGLQLASLDHALWIHRPCRADEWLLYSHDSPSASGSRGLARGAFHDADGRLVASVAQEGLMRRLRPRA